VIPAEEMMTLTMDYDSLSKAKSGLGSAAVIVMDETTDMVKTLMRASRFFYAESCGQCTPCREGTGWMYRVIRRIVEGQGRPEDIELLEAAAGQIAGHTICAFGEAASWPVQSFLKHFKHEFIYYVEHKRSMVEAAA
jgi:NADH-quinone oxidoreductase subunit F